MSKKEFILKAETAYEKAVHLVKSEDDEKIIGKIAMRGRDAEHEQIERTDLESLS